MTVVPTVDDVSDVVAAAAIAAVVVALLRSIVTYSLMVAVRAG